MAPNIVEGRETEGYVLEEVLHQNVKTDNKYKLRISWPQFIFHILINIFAVYGGYIHFKIKLWTHIWSFMIGLLTGLAIAINTHRGFSHRSYKATKTAQIVGLALHIMAGQNSTYTWARDHRVHHKYSDTDADPHNINRGFFFAHMGWLVTKKHPLVIEKQRMIDVSDLRANKLVMFQHRYFVPLYFVLGFLIPVFVPIYGWNESFSNSFFICYCFRYVISLNLTWCVNSIAHSFGMKPYDKRIRAVQSRFVSVTTFGEGWHNFHHSFPWDYRSSEFELSGISTLVIEQLARWGFLYDLKTASNEIIHGHQGRHGNGTNNMNKEENDRPSEKETDPSVVRSIALNSL